MATTQDRAHSSGPLSQLITLGRRLFGTETHETEPAADRRTGTRLPLELPIDACLEGNSFQEGRTLDVGPRGLALELAEGGTPGQRVSVRFAPSEAGLPMFMLHGRVVRVWPESAGRIGVNLRRVDNPPEALEAYRKLVLHHLRQTRLERLEELDSR